MKSFIKGLRHLPFENSMQVLPIDKSGVNKPRKVRQYLNQVVGYVYSEVIPEQKENPKLIAYSQRAFSLINVDLDPSDQDNVHVLAGNLVPDLAKPVAHCYCGFQFGNWAGQLGDGRAISLGDVYGYDLQLKGAGMTPFSRFADGKAVLRSSIREFLCSEAMHALGIPTTRAASIVLTDNKAVRDMYYTNNPKEEKCAVVLRMAPTFIRFGSFEVELEQNPKGSLVPQLWKYTERFFETQDRFREIVFKTAKLVALWQCYGFCHGVLNTDNMSLIGLTIDYGPFAFIDYFNKSHICNHSDDQGRYSYENQPGICRWNLLRLCEALESVIDKEKAKDIVNKEYGEEYNRQYYSTMLKRLGLVDTIVQPSVQQRMLVDQFFDVLHKCSTNYTKVFSVLREFDQREEFTDEEFTAKDLELVQKLVALSAPKTVYLRIRKPKISINQLAQLIQIQESKPMMLQMMGVDSEQIAISMAEHKEFEQIAKLSEEERLKNFEILWKDWVGFYKSQAWVGNRREIMDKANPKYTLTNSVLQRVIEQSENGNHTLLRKVQEAIENPQEEWKELEEVFSTICQDEICVSCSS